MVNNEAVDLPKLAAPARRALIEAGYTHLEQLTHITEASLTELRGVGAAATQSLRTALHERGLTFLPEARDIDIDLSYALDITLSSSFRPYNLDEAPFEEMWVTASLDPELMEIDPELLTSAGLPLELGRGQRTLVELHCGEDLVFALDARDADSLDLASHLFSGDQLQAHVAEMCEGFAGCVLLMDHFALHPAWRGLALGPLISLATMRTLALGRDIMCAALHAAPTFPAHNDIPHHERRQIAKKIKNAWQRCGFEKLTETEVGWIMVAPSVGDSV